MKKKEGKTEWVKKDVDGSCASKFWRATISGLSWESGHRLLIVSLGNVDVATKGHTYCGLSCGSAEQQKRTVLPFLGSEDWTTSDGI